jgi:uncharacterized protein (TIGR02145 family)
LTRGHHKYKLSGLVSGMFVLHIKSIQYSYITKIASTNSTLSMAEIKHIETVPASSLQPPASNTEKNKSLKGIKSLKDLSYMPGDTLKLTGVSGIYSTVFMLVPTQSQTVTFNFIKCTDVDNNNYAVVQIGTQTWMEENLKTTMYDDGSPIPNVTDRSTWAGLSTPGYCWFDNDASSYKSTYGALYNWFAVNTGKLCPAGWHVPDTAEWNKLFNFLGGSLVAGGKIKETCSTYWASPNIGASNSSGLTCLPGGIRSDTFGDFGCFGRCCSWWSATENTDMYACHNTLNSDSQNTGIYCGYKKGGYPVRCLKD